MTDDTTDGTTDDLEAIEGEATEEEPEQEPLPEKPFSARTTPLERQLGYAAAAVFGVIGAAWWIVQAIVDKNGADAGIGLLLLVGGAALVLAVRSGRRIILLVAVVLVSFIPPSPLVRAGSPLQLVMLIFAGYTMIKTSNAAGKRAGLERNERAGGRR